VPNSAGCTHNAPLHTHKFRTCKQKLTHTRARARTHTCLCGKDVSAHTSTPTRYRAVKSASSFFSSFLLCLSLCLVLSPPSLTRTRHKKDDAEHRAPVPGEAPAGRGTRTCPTHRVSISRPRAAWGACGKTRACSPTERAQQSPGMTTLASRFPSCCWQRSSSPALATHQRCPCLQVFTDYPKLITHKKKENGCVPRTVTKRSAHCAQGRMAQPTWLGSEPSVGNR